MPFTFYGDLLGISNAYKLSPEAGYEKLNRFYNVCFQHLKSACQGNHAQVNLFSDSIFFWGDNQRLALQTLKQLYANLTSEGLLLRGAIVSGKLEFEPRNTVERLEKRLPIGDILPRVVSLASNYKGARLIVDREITHSQLPGVKWHTIEGYFQSHQLHRDIPQFDTRRFICPTPDGTAYELLYFYPISAGIPLDYDGTISYLRNMSKMISKEFTEHYSETISLIERSQLRAEL
jgi:hypothetical protein